MSNLTTENNPETVLIDHAVNPDRLLNTAVYSTEVKDNLSRPTLKRFTKVYPHRPRSAVKNMQISDPGAKRKSKQKTPSSPANYKRKIISLISSLENSTLETPVNNSTKRELVGQFEIMKTQIIDKLKDIMIHLEI